MKLLITGGAGYIGSNIVETLATNFTSFDITVLDDGLRGGNLNALKNLKFPVKIWQKKLEELSANELVKFGFDIVIHSAANAYVGESYQKPHLYLGRNVLATSKLLAALDLSKTKKIIFSSTCAVYGTQSSKISEEANIAPESPYGWSKYICENLLESYAQRYGFSLIIFRYFNVAGASVDFKSGEKHNPETHLIPLLYEAAIKSEIVDIFGSDYITKDGTCEREYVHIKDIVVAHLNALEVKFNKKINHINLCTGNPFSVLEVVKTAEKVWNKTIHHRFNERRLGDAETLRGDFSNAKRLLDWEPTHSNLTEILNDYKGWRIRQHDI